MTTATRSTSTPSFGLDSEQAQLFRKQGFLGPFAICPPEEMDRLRPKVDAVLESDAPDHTNRVHNRHLDHRLIYDLAAHPRIVERMAAVYGPDLLLWRTNFFNKQPGSREIPWHQDYNYWPIEPAIVISAWLAIDRVTTENSCVQIIPGSHRRIVRHVKSTDGMWFDEMADPDGFDASQAVNMELEPGEFFIFNERTLHHSDPNRSDKRRLGMAVRVIVPMVQALGLDAPEHRMIQLCGEDRFGLNPTTQPPTA